MKSKTALLLLLDCIAGLLAVLSVLVFVLANKDNIIANNREYLLDNTKQMALLVNDSLLAGLTNIRMLSKLTGAMLTSPTVDVARLQRILDHSIYDFIEFADVDGKNHNTTGGMSEAADREYYLKAMRGNSGVELIYKSRATVETIIFFYAPVYYQGKIIGSILGSYQGTRHLEKLLNMDVFGHKAQAFLCDKDGNIIASNQNIDTRDKISVNTFLAQRKAADSANFSYEGATKIVPLRDNETGACVMRLKNFDWYVVQIFPEQANQLMVASANRIGLILAVFLTAILSALLYLTYKILNCARMKAQNALVKAEAASNAKTDFLFNMSHDIRTPMNAIVGFLRLLKEKQDIPPRRREYIRKMEDSTALLLAMINNILQMSRLETGQIALEETIWSVEQIFDSVYVVIGPRMQAKNITFKRIIETQHQFVWCDALCLQEILLNILNNATTYTPRGGKVSLRLSEIPADSDDHAFFKIEVADSGIGIAPEFLPHIFEPFSREQNTTRSKIAGIGLGLPIAKRLADLMGGTIAVESEKDKGTTVTVLVPLHLPGEEEIEKRKPRRKVDEFLGKRILLAEDNDFNAEIATELLTDVGFKVDWAEDGEQCVAMLERAEDNYYDLILMDVQMPRMDGYQATETIRKMADLSKASIPIIAMTANTFEEDKKNAFAAGVDAHLGKPIDVNKLLATLRKF